VVELFDSWVHRLGELGYLVVGLAAMIEYLFPPFPGDTVLVLGGAYAVRGEQSLLGVFVAVTLGSVVGLSAHWWLGKVLARRLEGAARLPFGIEKAKLTRLQAKMLEKGSWILAANRFIPSLRALIFIAAGAAHIPYRRAVALGALSAMAWNAVLIGVGYAVGGKAERLATFVSHWHRSVFAALALVGVVLLARWAWSWRQQRRT